MTRSITRRQLLAGISSAAALRAAAARPNIILILADDLGIGDLGCYGQKILSTPNIDRLAAEGLRFRNAYSGSMVCAPSRCSLMTGYHMGHATVRGNWETYPEGQHPLAERDITVAACLKQAGYTTGICGKWGLGGPDSRSAPNKAGFDFFYGYNCQRHAHRYFTDYLWRNTERIPILQSSKKRIYAQDLIAEESLRFIRENRNRPFFLFCAWTLPHGPYNLNNVTGVEKYAGTDWTEGQKCYAAMVERLDADVGRVMSEVSALGLDRNTLVLFASDNGAGGEAVNKGRFGSQGGLRGTKGSLCEGGIRVPQIARWPGRVPAGRTTEFLTAFWDFLPTAADLAGARAPGGIDGVSIVPTLLGRPQEQREYLYWERLDPKKLTRAVRMRDWKGYQETPVGPIELYDLESDPAESRDIAGEHPEVARRIRKIMDEARTHASVPPLDNRIWEKYKEDNRRLDALLAR